MDDPAALTSATDLVHLDAVAAGRLLRARAISPVELVQAFLDRIDQVDGIIKSYLLVDAEGALARARVAEAEIMAGQWRGPLHGIPYGVKDNYFTKGLRTCANSRVFLDHVPDFDSAAVERLGAAGAILLGKLNTWEFGTGHGLVYHDCAFDEARNPWKAEHFTGGSSTGAGASVAAGTAMFALGADTGGSIRMPAAACGLQGLKPTYGLVSRHGILPNSWSLDVAGPMTWTIADNALVLQALAGYDARDAGSADVAVPDYGAALKDGVRGLTIGVARHLFDHEHVQPAVRQGYEDVLAVLAEGGATFVDVTMPHPPLTYRQTTSLISGAERASSHEREFTEQADKMGRELREAMMVGFAARAIDYVGAQRRRRQLAVEIDALVRQYDAIILPCAYETAPAFGDFDAVRNYQARSMTTVFNISGHPALALRTGFDAGGMPTGIQIAGRHFDEATVLRIAQTYERARNWHTRRPQL